MNYVCFTILIYITVIILLIISKPDFIYDKKKNKFKKFGSKSNETYFTLPVVSMIIAVFIFIICRNHNKSISQSQQIMPYQITNMNPNLSNLNHMNLHQVPIILYQLPAQLPPQFSTQLPTQFSSTYLN